jgi:PAS domain S-box-containing protein
MGRESASPARRQRRKAGRPLPVRSSAAATAVAALNDAELALVATTTPLILTRCDRNMRFVFANRAAAALFGLTPDEVIGRPVAELLGEEAFAIVRPYIERVLAGEAVEYEACLPYKAVGPRWLRINYLPHREANGVVAGWVASIVDMTEGKLAEARLHESEARFVAFMRHLPGAAWIKDQHGRYIYVNPEAERVFGTTLANARGKTDAELFPPETARQFQENDRRALREEGGIQSVEVLRQPDGIDHRSIVSKFAVPGVNGEAACVGGVAFDVTAWLAAEDALRASEERYRSLTKAITSVVWTTDAEGRFVAPQGSWSEYTGQTWEEAQGWGWIEAFHPQDRERLRAAWRASCASREMYTAEGRLRHEASAAFRQAELRGVPIFDVGGTVREWVGTCIDVEDRTRAQESLREGEERLRNALDAADVGTWRVDLGTGVDTRDARLNRILGLEPRESSQPVGDFFAHVHPDDRPRASAAWEAALRGDGLYDVECRIIRPDGEVRWIRDRGRVVRGADGEPLYCTGAVADIHERMRAEAALSESRERYRHLVQSLPAAVYTCDAQGRITLFNEAAVQLWGRTPELGQERWCGSHRIYDDEGRRLAHEDSPMARAIRSGQAIRGAEIEIERPDGTRRHALAHPEPIIDAAGRVVGAVNMLIDITDRKRAEGTMRLSEKRFRMVADCSPVMIWMSGVNKACTWFNRRWLEFVGRTMEQELGDGWADGVHPDDVARCVQTYGAAFDARETFEMEYRLRRADGEYRWVCGVGTPLRLEDGAFTGYIGSCIDVTDRRLSEETLRERVTQRTLELSTANEQLKHEVDERRRVERLLATEKRILELMATGAERERLLGALCGAIESLLPGAQCVIRLAPSGGLAADDARASARAATVGLDLFGTLAEAGVCPPLCTQALVAPRLRLPADAALGALGIRSYWMEPITGPADSPVGVLGVYFREAGAPSPEAVAAGSLATRLAVIVVEAARAEERAREQLAQLAHVARLATMGEMASGLAHELNQPLCAIVNFTEACVGLLQRDGPERENLPQALNEVARQAQRAGEVIRRLRDFVKRREPERRAVDINALVREVVAFTNVELRHGDVRVRIALGKRLPKVFADSIQIEQVLVNLVRNACEAMRDADLGAKTLTIESVRRKGAVEVRVGDNGPGVPDELRHRLFEPFFTTKSDGMGMGLSISRSIMEVHEGRLWATPNRKGGTTFHFTIPTVWRVRHGRRHRVRRG